MRSIFTKFSQVIQDLKKLKISEAQLRNEVMFYAAVHAFKKLTDEKIEKQKPANSFLTVVEDIKNLSYQVYPARRLDSIKLIESNNSKLQISCFELMEHDFRENTHSNVFQYLFDYHFSGNTGPELISNLIDDGKSPISKLTDKLRTKNYRIYREKSTSSGRMDLFIVDKVHKFAIVIENKVLANVALKESEEPEIEKTQLTDYVNYLNEYYQGFDKEYILLSFRKPHKEFFPFRFKSYESLSAIVEKLSSRDPILTQYRLLLRNLQNPVSNKPKRVREATLLIDNEAILPLNNIELINLILYETKSNRHIR